MPLLDGSHRQSVNLDNAASTPALRPVYDKVNDLLSWYSGIHRGIGFKSQTATQAYELARAVVTCFVKADPATNIVILGLADFCRLARSDVQDVRHYLRVLRARAPAYGQVCRGLGPHPGGTNTPFGSGPLRLVDPDPRACFVRRGLHLNGISPVVVTRLRPK